MRKFFKHTGWLVLLALATTAQAMPDPDFGEGGFVTLGFQPENGSDHGVVACAGPLDSLFVAGSASNGNRIVTAWLTPSGQLDTRFSGDGKESVPLPIPDGIGGAVGLCAAQGGPAMAWTGFVSPSSKVHIVRLNATTGLLDGGFDADGEMIVDLGDYVSDVIDQVLLSSLHNGPHGSLLLSGFYVLDNGNTRRPFLLRLGGSGGVMRTAFGAQFGPNVDEVRAAGVASDGSIWAAGAHRPDIQSSGAFVARLNPDTLEPYEFVASGAGGPVFLLQGARLIDGDTMLLTGQRSVDDPESVEPRLETLVVVVTRTRRYEVVLPLPSEFYPLAVQVIPWSSGTALVGATVVNTQTELQGQYFARLVDEPQWRVDPRFGTPIVHKPAAPGCIRNNRQSLSRMTIWQQQPVVIGTIDNGCTQFDNDYLVLRLMDPTRFLDGFEGADKRAH